MEFFLILWIPCCIMIGIAAHRHFGRDGVGWFMLSVVISPLLAGLFLICVGRKPIHKPKAINWKTINWPQSQSINVPRPPSQLDFALYLWAIFLVLGVIAVLTHH